MSNTNALEVACKRVNLSLTDSQYSRVVAKFSETFNIDPSKLPEATFFKLVIEDWLANPSRKAMRTARGLKFSTPIPGVEK